MKIKILVRVCLTGLWVSSLFEGDAVGQQPVLIEDGSGKFTAVNTDQASDAELSVGDVAPDIVLIGIDAKPFRLSEVTKRGKNVVPIFSRVHW